jgi:hypothetical protein
VTVEFDARALFAALGEARVSYVVIGGWAVNAHGYVRVTRDLDICPASDRPNLDRLAALLRELNGRQLGLDDFAPDELPADPRNADDLAMGGNFRVETDLGVLDVMQWVNSTDGELTYEELAADAIEAQPWGIPVRVCSRERLIAMKRQAGRPRDQDDLAHLLADPAS